MTTDFTTPAPGDLPAESTASPTEAGDAAASATRVTILTLARQRRRVMARMWAAAEGQIQEIESRLGLLQGGGADVEREARTLALLARVVRELSREASTASPGPAGTRRPARAKGRRFPTIHRNDPGGSEDEQTSRNLEQLRDDLARHLERLREAAGASGPAGNAERA